MENQAARLATFEQMLESGFAAGGSDVLSVHFDEESESWVGQWFGILSQGTTREEAIVATVSAVVMHRSVEVELQAARIAALEAALRKAQAHVDELRDAWQRGCIREFDGLGGTRSTRNADVAIALRAALVPKPEGQ